MKRSSFLISFTRKPDSLLRELFFLETGLLGFYKIRLDDVTIENSIKS